MHTLNDKSRVGLAQSASGERTKPEARDGKG
jgi:hypothetical protein